MEPFLRVTVNEFAWGLKLKSTLGDLLITLSRSFGIEVPAKVGILAEVTPPITLLLNLDYFYFSCTPGVLCFLLNPDNFLNRNYFILSEVLFTMTCRSIIYE
jgi:hypothetical protein